MYNYNHLNDGNVNSSKYSFSSVNNNRMENITSEVYQSYRKSLAAGWECDRYSDVQVTENNVDYSMDYGPNPFIVNIDEATKKNTAFRSALWTGNHMQLTLMSLGIGEDIGVEIHPDVDQFIRIEQGQGMVQMGESRENMNIRQYVYDDYAFIVPAGTWHNLVNTGKGPLKVYSIYAPPQHPRGTIHVTKEDAMREEKEH